MSQPEISIPKPAKKSWSCWRIYIRAATPLSSSPMNETSPLMRGALSICATDSLSPITRDLFRSSTCRSRDELAMKRFLYELSESWKIAAAQMRSNLTRSTLTALGVIIGIIAVTLMGTAVNGISIGFDKSMAVLGDDVLYVTQWPWKPV